MANIKSQKKRILTSREENRINTAKKSKVKTAIKKFEAAVAANDIKLAEELLPTLYQVIDQAKSDGIFHINTAGRKKARLAKLLNSAKNAVVAE